MLERSQLVLLKLIENILRHYSSEKICDLD